MAEKISPQKVLQNFGVKIYGTIFGLIRLLFELLIG